MTKHYIQRAVGEGELRALSALAITEEARFFNDNPHLIAPYRDRLVAVALCQGAALQFLGCGYGVNDFDLHYFYAQNPDKPRLTRSWVRRSADVGAFPNVPVDFLRTVIPTRLHRSDGNAVELIQAFLRKGPTSNARHLQRKAVVGLLPAALFGVVIWEPRANTT
jgi:hypothetical protein